MRRSTLPLGALIACGGGDDGPARRRPEPEPEIPALAVGDYSGAFTVTQDGCAGDLGLEAWVPAVREVSATQATLLLATGVQITCAFDGSDAALCTPFERDVVSPGGSYLRLHHEPVLTVTDDGFELRETVDVTCNYGACPELGGAACTTEILGRYTPRDLWWDANVIWVSGEFGYDQETDRVVPFRRDGVEVPITVVLTIANTAVDEACTVVLEHEDPTEPELYTSEADLGFAFLGFQLPGGSWRKGAASTCDTDTGVPGTQAWDPYLWGEDPADVFAGKAWGLGVGPEEDIATYFPLDPIPDSFGGGFYSSRLAFDAYSPVAQPAFVTWARATGCVTDAGAVVEDGVRCAPIPPEDVEAALDFGTLPTGAYTVHVGAGFGVTLLLD